MNTAAVVVRWRGGEEVDRCLQSLLDHGGSQLTQIVLVDSGSGDGGAERLTAAFSDVEVLALEENLSFAHAANTGVAATTGESVLLLNPDTVVEEDALTNLVTALRRRPAVSGVVPALLNPDGTSQHGWQLRRLPSAMRLATGRPGMPAFPHPPTRPAAVAQPAAAAWLVRREVWRALGGLDEAFSPAWWEDVDFCARLGQRLGDPGFPADNGFEVVPEASVVHSGGSSVGELDDAGFLSAYYSNLIRFAERHHPDRIGLIRQSLKLTLIGRSLLRPEKRRAYLDFLRIIGEGSRD